MTSLRKTTLTSFIIFIFTITTVNSFECPEECLCSITPINDDDRLYSFKCNSIDWLKEDGKNVSIHFLDISDINLTRVPNYLEKLKDLMTIDLSNNHLSEIGRFGRRVLQLNVSHNRITSGKLNNLPPFLKYLDLSYNEITYLPLDLKNLKYLRAIELTGNTIHCSCETLEVRNWLQQNHVWTDNHIKCSYPIEVKGKSWLQVKQSDICDNSKLIKNEMDNDNELMFGDEPIKDEGSADGETFEELGKDYLPVDLKNSKKLSEYKNDVEGSGDDNEQSKSYDTSETSHGTEIQENVEVSSSPHPDEEEEDGSGVGILPTIFSIDHQEETTLPSSTLEESEEEESIGNCTTSATQIEEDSSESELKPSLIPDAVDSLPEEVEFTTTIATTSATLEDIFGDGLGIVQFPKKDLSTSESPLEESPAIAVEEEPVVPEKVENIETAVTGEQNEKPDDVNIQRASMKIPSNMNSKNAAGKSENQGAYILLGIILFIVIFLIIFVGIRRSRMRRHRIEEDLENPKSTELVDMDKKNLGKPFHKNGAAEHAPLINDRTKPDLEKSINANGKKIPYEPKECDNYAQEPLLKKDDTNPSAVNQRNAEARPTESNNNLPNNIIQPSEESRPQQQTITPVPAVRQSLANAEPTHQYKPGGYPPPPKTKVTSENDEHHPTTPRPSRYSPVYSPETGRVKIKLTETPRPKTPLLVTRSRSNAGEIITTPTSNAEILQETKPTADK